MALPYPVAVPRIPASTPRTNFSYPRVSHPMRVHEKSEYLYSSPRSRSAANAGESVNALNNEIAIEKAMVNENCRYRMPVVPGKNDTGTKTEISTREVATTALATSAIATDVAVWESVWSASMWRCAFSMTTIASSTTSPVARVIPNSVRELMENPNIFTKANVPTRETGIVTAGIIVARQSSKKRKITMMTIRIASSRVVTTSFTESPTTVVVSNAITYFIPGGNDFESSWSSALAARSTSSAFALESCCTPTPIASCPLYIRLVS